MPLAADQELLEDVREQLIGGHVFPSCQELPGGDLVENGRRFVVPRRGAHNVALQSVDSRLQATAVPADQRDLVTAGLVLAAAQVAGVGGRILWGAVAGLLLSARYVLMSLGLLMAAFSLALVVMIALFMVKKLKEIEHNHKH